MSAGLSDLQSERLILGSVMLDGSRFAELAEQLTAKDFTLEAHRTIWRRMADVAEDGLTPGLVTVSSAMMAHPGDVEAAGGFAYLAELDNGMPRIPKLEDWVSILKTKSTLRDIVRHCELVRGLAENGADSPQGLIERSLGYLGGLQWQTNGPSAFQTPIQAIQAAGGIDPWYDRDADRGIPTGLTGLDNILGGWQVGQVAFLGGKPSRGKTTLAVQFAGNAALMGYRVAYYALEQTTRELIDLLVSQKSGVDRRYIRDGAGATMPVIRQATAEVAELENLYFRQIPSITGHQMERELGQLVRGASEGPKWLAVFDYGGLMEVEGRTTVDKLAAIARGLQRMAGRLNIAILVLWHLKDYVTAYPGMEDFAGTSEVSKAAYQAVAIHQPDVTTELIEVGVVKNKIGGFGWVPMRFEKRTGRIWEEAR